MPDAPPPETAKRLIAYLRAALGRPELEYSAELVRLTGGFDTSVYAFALADAPAPFDVPLVARVFGPGDPAGRVVFESAVHDAVARQGFPTPAVAHVCTDSGPLGASFFIMARAPGRRLVDYLPTRSLLRVVTLLAQTQARLHRLDSARISEALSASHAPPIPNVPGDALAAFRQDVEAAGLEMMRPALAWLETHTPAASPNVLCHMDFHPLNILADGHRVTGVIDWSNCAIGPAAADVGVTRIILELGPLDVPAVARPLVELFRRWATGRYTNIYRRSNPVAMEDVRYFEAMRCFAAMLNVALIRTQGEEARPIGYAWNSPQSVRAMRRRFRKVTGVSLRLPPGRRPRT